ncbi:DNA repair metallo-beta-lactamase [Drechmeria coniospora]|uniref:DNA repair metallo-beta-lactamase n=1 Tax=Drechmeria coniospora TaxID=98403 RepID=A0A151GID6_DRECN|nr:DNA repair metallo-beta-lactamase [Drechmeria coniospora]KYK56856.1 DNA repair metallo-beta-lactamase [Drechmeria coniospora]
MVTTTKTNQPKAQKRLGTLASFPRKPSQPNASILNFFQKTHKPEDSLFVGAPVHPTTTHDDIPVGDDDLGRLNESQTSAKRRRVSEDRHTTVVGVQSIELRRASCPEHAEQSKRQKSRHYGNTPFVVDSDSEAEDSGEAVTIPDVPRVRFKAEAVLQSTTQSSCAADFAGPTTERTQAKSPPFQFPDSAHTQADDIQDPSGMDDLDMEAFEGEELREMKFMREQARIEAEDGGTLLFEDFGDDLPGDATADLRCPICDGSLAGISPDDATRHVNLCLDGNPTPLSHRELKSPSQAPPVESTEMSKRFIRATIPRPAQFSPFDKVERGTEVKSAFSKLMSGNAEDSAWATAAAAEHASRGRPAYERTCPFYKNIPNFNICVDAFRYGAVEGCKAYFLSHFHSDHYIGLTASWRHGPIFCSKVTGSLVKNQLRTKPEWIVELDFEKPYPVPGTGATVTMIPANHCPGSSMFLFEKPLSNAPTSRLQRVLHCGDFRACPAHVDHPLLKPDVVDSITRKTQQQIINTCYLDTTYLNPRYSFPPQEDVIKACADLCASTSPDPNCKDDILDAIKRDGSTQAVSEYFLSGKADEASKTETSREKPGQRLLIICGTYSIGKERICIAIAKALRSKIYATPAKMKICKQLDDPELAALLTSDPIEAQVHMQSLMEIRADTLHDYLTGYKPHFSRIIGFRPSGWNFRPTNGRAVGANVPPSAIPTTQILHDKGWRTRFEYRDFVAQRGSTKEAMCFGVPYSEHSSFRELAMFLMCLRIERVIPTVNVGSEQSRKRMRGWIDRWLAERRRGGVVTPLLGGEGKDDDSVHLWDGKSGKGGSAWW